jgi:integrase
MARATIDGFRTYLEESGLSSGTVDVYVRDVRIARESSVSGRLRDGALAPKTRRHILAAARHWAEYSGDDQLTKQLKKIRLPPPRRKEARVPVTRDDLLALVDELGKADYLEPAMRATLGMMARRGFRCGDVLRLQRAELVAARDHGILSYEAKGQRRLEFKVIPTYRHALVELADAPGRWSRVCELVSPHATAKGRMKAAAKAIERSLVEVGVKIGILGLYPHRLRRTYAVEYLRSLKGDPEAIVKLQQHMQWASMATAMEYIDHARGDELDAAAEKIFER